MNAESILERVRALRRMTLKEMLRWDDVPRIMPSDCIARGELIMKWTLFLFFVVNLSLPAHSQTKKVPCYAGDSYPSCTPAQRTAKAKALAKARTAAVIIEAKQGIACGDGSDGCIRTDSAAIAIIQKEVDDSELWQSLTKMEAKKADILLKFNTRDQTSLQLCAYNADSNDLLWCDYRNPSIALDNDSARELVHFLQARQAALSRDR